MLANYEAKINANENVLIPYKTDHIENTRIGPNVTHCINCRVACHEGCAYGDNGPNGMAETKEHCIAMKNGFCEKCPKHCKYT